MVDILKKTFSYTLLTKRAQLNYSQETMSEKCCISLKQYIDLEHGSYLPSFQTLVNLTINLGFNYNDFIVQVTKNGYKPLDKDNSA